MGDNNYLLPIQPFDCDGEPRSVGAHTEPSNTEGEVVDVYKTAITKLNEYFLPKQSKIYERHLFRLTKQEDGEKFDKFLVRLRNQSSKCKFSNEEEHLIDQIVEKCTSVELRKKILAIGDNINLETIISEANVLEAVNRQLEGFSGQSGKTLDDTFKYYCRTNPRKRKQNNQSSEKTGRNEERSNNRKRQKLTGEPSKNRRENEEIDNIESNETDYVFSIDDDSTIKCNIGGVSIEMLIDSGSRSNLLDDKTWTLLKKGNIKVWDQVQNPDKLLFAYGSKNPLKILGSFKSKITVGGKSDVAIFYVIKDGSRCLLGKTTAVALGVLRIGLEVFHQLAKPYIFDNYFNTVFQQTTTGLSNNYYLG
ncbi:hypothetical protein NQ315_000650 [Exocentrus adspersus]|uniref:Peptidase A2 domain-containing protein n=1 Tax=Exocentrus adspersus TaxID=1586481 RepID=A0AAV8VPJ6_9CUCU|nr:hypothetical protein NQ315_000650 [Exocentrus adspersus]